MADEEHHRSIAQRLCNALELRIVNVDIRVVVAATRRAIQRDHDVERERRLRGGHLAQVARGLPEHVRHRAVQLLRGVGDQVAKLRVGEYLAVQDPGNLVTHTADHALGAFQRNQRLAGDILGQPVSARTVCSVRPSLAQFIQRCAGAHNVGHALGPVFRQPPAPQLAGLRDATVEQVLQRTRGSGVRCRQPGDAQRLHPGISLPRSGGQLVVGHALAKSDE